MSKQYTPTVTLRTARPRSKRLQNLGATSVVAPATVASVTAATTAPDPNSHSHANKALLDSFTIIDEGYLATSTIDDNGDATINKVNAGHADTTDEACHAATADVATEAGHAILADMATEADHAAAADTATDADRWDGLHAEDYINQPVRSHDSVRHKSVTTGDENTSLTIGKSIKSQEHMSGVKGLGLWKDSDGAWHIETDHLAVHRKATFESIDIQKTTHVGGRMMLTAAAATISHVKTYQEGYRCFFRRKNEDQAIDNLWVVDDQAYSSTFNLEGGAAANHYLWRLVTATSNSHPIEEKNITTDDGIVIDSADYHYIDLSLSTAAMGSDAPKVGDHLVQLGHRGNDTSRMSAIILAGAGEESPAILQLSNINSFALPDPDTQIKPGDNRFSGRVKLEAGSSGFEHLGVELGGGNLVRNGGFTGDYLSSQLSDDVVLRSTSAMWNEPFVHWNVDAACAPHVADTNQTVSGKLCHLPDGGYIEQILSSGIVEGEKYVLSFMARSTEGGKLQVTWLGGGYEAALAPGETFSRYTFTATADSSTIDMIIDAYDGDVEIADVQIERGNVASSWRPNQLDNASDRAYYQALHYLAAALNGSTEIDGGLLLTSLIRLGEWVGGVMSKVNAGINGIATSSDSPAFWAGGDMAQAIATITALKALPTATFDPKTMAPFAVTHRGEVFAANGNFRGSMHVTGSSTGWEKFSGLKMTIDSASDAASEAQSTANDAKTRAADAVVAAATAEAKAKALEYLRSAITKGDTAIAGGLVLANILATGENGVTSDLSKIRAFISGRTDDGAIMGAHDSDAYRVVEAFLAHPTSATRPNLAITKSGKLYAKGADIEGDLLLTGNLMYRNARQITEEGNYIVRNAGTYLFGSKEAPSRKYNVKIDIPALPAGAVVTLISANVTEKPSELVPHLPTSGTFWGRDGRGIPMIAEAVDNDDAPSSHSQSIYLDDQFSADGIMPCKSLVCLCDTPLQGINAAYDLVADEEAFFLNPAAGRIYHDPVDFLSWVGGYVSLIKVDTDSVEGGVLYVTDLCSTAHLISSRTAPSSWDNAWGGQIDRVQLDLRATNQSIADWCLPCIQNGSTTVATPMAAVYYSGERVATVAYTDTNQIQEEFTQWI